jgi:hypothetical protein
MLAHKLRVAVTGHTGGLGLALFNHFKSNGHDVIGFSRSNGYDIALPSVREKIVNELSNVDLFVNNAYVNYDRSQFLMLSKVFDSWKGVNRTIVNISTRYTNEQNDYCITKHEQDIFCQERIYQLPHIINLKPGMIDTQRVSNMTGNKLPPKDVVQMLDYALENNVHSITFGKR